MPQTSAMQTVVRHANQTFTFQKAFKYVKQNFRNIGINFLCSFLLVVIIGVVVFTSDLLTSLSSSFAGALLLLIYLLTIAGLICFYILTTQYKAWLTILNFLLNFVLWITEQIMLEGRFYNSYFYQDENAAAIFVLIFGAFLWTLNKIAFDNIFKLFTPKLQEKTLFERLLKI